MILIVIHLPSLGAVTSCNDKSHSKSHFCSTFFVSIPCLRIVSCPWPLSRLYCWFYCSFEYGEEEKMGIKSSGLGSVSIICSCQWSWLLSFCHQHYREAAIFAFFPPLRPFLTGRMVTKHTLDSLTNYDSFLNWTFSSPNMVRTIRRIYLFSTGL